MVDAHWNIAVLTRVSPPCHEQVHSSIMQQAHGTSNIWWLEHKWNTTLLLKRALANQNKHISLVLKLLQRKKCFHDRRVMAAVPAAATGRSYIGRLYKTAWGWNCATSFPLHKIQSSNTSRNCRCWHSTASRAVVLAKSCVAQKHSASGFFSSLHMKGTPWSGSLQS